jgi:hypothetical protein
MHFLIRACLPTARAVSSCGDYPLYTVQKCSPHLVSIVGCCWGSLHLAATSRRASHSRRSMSSSSVTSAATDSLLKVRLSPEEHQQQHQQQQEQINSSATQHPGPPSTCSVPDDGCSQALDSAAALCICSLLCASASQ